jgi:hypothetical protein
MTWSRTQINKLGDQIRDAGLSDEDRFRLLEYRATFVPAYENVVTALARALSVANGCRLRLALALLRPNQPFSK